MRTDGTVKVLDFGLAKVRVDADLSREPTVTESATSPGVVLGTVPYMSPEQARGHEVDRRTDLWAFGCVLYEVLTGMRAFPGETHSDTIAAILGREPDWHALPARAPASVRLLLHRCLERDPKRRLRDAGDARLELDDTAATARAVAGQPAGQTDRAASGGRRWAILTSLGALTGILLVGAAAWYLNTLDYFWQNTLADAQFTQLTDFEGAEDSAAISRDGQFVVFVSDQDGSRDAWIGQIGTGGFHNLTEGRISTLGNPNLRNARFTPDGSLISLWVREAGGVMQWTVPTLGGQVRPFREGVAELDWSPDGTRIAYHTNEPGDPIYVTEPDAGAGQPIFTASEGAHNHFPIWSPQGTFIYFVSGFVPDQMDVWRIRPTGGEPERITPHNATVSYPTLLDERTLLYLATAEDGSGPWLYAMDVERRIPHRVSVGVQRYTSIAASADGRRIVATVASSSESLWRVEIGDEPVGESAARRIPLPAVRGRSPRLGPGYMLFLSSRSGVDTIWKVADDAALELWRGSEGRVVGGPAIEPDGGRIAFPLQQRSGQTRLYLMNEDGTGIRRLAESLDVRGAPAWSPDEQWITVAADQGSGPRLFGVPPDGGAPVPLVDDHSEEPAWSPDGQFLVYAGAEVGPAFSLGAVSSSGTPLPLVDLNLTRGARFSFVPAGSALVVLKGEVRNTDFSVVDLETGQEQALTDFGGGYTIRDFDLSADGREIVFDRVAETSDVILIEVP